VDGEHDTVVVVGRRLTVSVNAALVLPAWAVSVAAGVYAPVRLTEPAADAVNVAVHVEVPTGLVP